MEQNYGCPSSLQACTTSLRRLIHEQPPQLVAWNESIGLLRAFFTTQMLEPITPKSLEHTSKASVALLIIDALSNTPIDTLSNEDLSVLENGLALLERSGEPSLDEEHRLFKEFRGHNWAITSVYAPAEPENYNPVCK